MIIERIKNKWFLAVLIFVSIAVNVYFRLNSYFLPELTRQAKAEVNARFEAQARQILLGVHPELKNLQEDRYSAFFVKQVLKEQQAQIHQGIVKRTKELKDYYRDDNGFPYLLEVDPYRWLRRIQSFLSTGHFGSFRKASVEYDGLMSFPDGAKVEPLKFHFYLGAYWYKLVHACDPHLSLMNCLAVLPVMVSVILIVMIFVVSIQLGISYLGSFIASLAIGVCVLAIGRTTYGWFDTDIYNLIMPLCIFSATSAAFKSSAPKNLIFFAISGILVGVYSALWSIWWLFFYIIIAGMLLAAIDSIFFDAQRSFPSKIKVSGLSLALFMFVSYLSVAIISGFKAVGASFSEPFLYLSLRQGVTLDNFWPNLSFSINELQKPDIFGILVLLGGPVVFYGALIGQLSTYTVRKENFATHQRKFMAFLLFLWFLIALFLTNFGSRFIFFLIIPIGLHFGALLDLGAYIVDKVRFLNEKTRFSLFLCLFSLMCAIPIHNATQLTTFPHFMNDSVWNMMMKIRELTPQNAVIQTSWDAGDYIMTLADRATIHDASWQFSPAPYWFDRAVVAKSEEETVAILRMLTASGNKAFEELLKITGYDKFQTIEILNKLLFLTPDEGRKLLYGYSQEASAIKKVLKYMYEPRVPAYLLINSQMAATVPVLGLVGKWDFSKLRLWQKSRMLSREAFIEYAKKMFGYKDEAARMVYTQLRFIDDDDSMYWISDYGFKLFTSTNYAKIKEDADASNTVLFDNGLALDTKGVKAYYYDIGAGRWIIPGYFATFISDQLKISEIPGGDSNYAAFLGREADEYKAILVSKEFLDSVLFRLYFAQGTGLKHFKLLHREFSKGKANLLLYKIDWDGSS